MKTPKPKIGSSMPYWFNEDAIVVRVFPYTGRYPQWFTWVVGLTTKHGTVIETVI